MANPRNERRKRARAIRKQNNRAKEQSLMQKLGIPEGVIVLTKGSAATTAPMRVISPASPLLVATMDFLKALVEQVAQKNDPSPVNVKSSKEWTVQ